MVALAGFTASCSLLRVRPPQYPAQEFEGGLVVQDLVVPDDAGVPVATDGARVVIDYEARIVGGELVDSSFERGQPAEFTLGGGEMPLAGLDRGVLGMKQRGRRRIVAPPPLAFGTAGVPGRVPPDATIEFVVELRRVHGGADPSTLPPGLRTAPQRTRPLRRSPSIDYFR